MSERPKAKPTPSMYDISSQKCKNKIETVAFLSSCVKQNMYTEPTKPETLDLDHTFLFSHNCKLINVMTKNNYIYDRYLIISSVNYKINRSFKQNKQRYIFLKKIQLLAYRLKIYFQNSIMTLKH